MVAVAWARAPDTFWNSSGRRPTAHRGWRSPLSSSTGRSPTPTHWHQGTFPRTPPVWAGIVVAVAHWSNGAARRVGRLHPEAGSRRGRQWGEPGVTIARRSAAAKVIQFRTTSSRPPDCSTHEAFSLGVVASSADRQPPGHRHRRQPRRRRRRRRRWRDTIPRKRLSTFAVAR